MAHLRCDFRSESLDMNTSMTVVLPEGVKQSEVPVIYLLHGLSDNCTGWSRYTSVERYVREYGAALVIPEVQRSYYTDMAEGIDYFTYIHDELPKICRGFFGFSDSREKNYIMGLSMGGYAALKCAFTTPERYAGVAAFSAVADISESVRSATEKRQREFRAIFGNIPNIPDNCELFALAGKILSARSLKLYMACGEQDEFFTSNERLAAYMEKLGADIRFEHWEGIHDWVFWDSAVYRAIKMFFSHRRQQ